MNHNSYLLNNLGQRRLLESNTRIPLNAQRLLHTSLELRFARIRIRQILDKVLGCLLVAFL